MNISKAYYKYMAQLVFYYGTINCGKSAALLQKKHNYEEKNKNVVLFIPSIVHSSSVQSRVGLTEQGISFSESFDFLDYVKSSKSSKDSNTSIDCVLIDEAQFLTSQQVVQLCRVVDEYHVDVYCYGLKIDFKGKMFHGSLKLFELADSCQEMSSVCFCGKKTTMNMKNQHENNISIIPTFDGNIVCNSVSLCRKCYMEIVSLQKKHS